MSSPFLPTTRAQVSGHRFLRRRVEHGLVFGDIRMIHDPLRTRTRGVIFGCVAVVLGMLGAGLFAWLNPQPDPGEADLLRADSGQLYVRIDERLHPVDNLTSARLIVGGEAQAQAIGQEHLRGVDKGPPLGITPAPDLLASDAPGENDTWAVCVSPSGRQVLLGPGAPAPTPLADNEAVLIDDWLVTSHGRRLLPDAESDAGGAVRRGLGITPETPVAQAPPTLINALAEHRPVAVPEPLPVVVETETGYWAENGETIAPLSQLQAEILAHAGAESRQAEVAELGTRADAAPPPLPEIHPEFLDPAERHLCALAGGGAGVLAQAPSGETQLVGETELDALVGLDGGAVAVDTGHGLHVVTATGVIHDTDAASVQALGLPEAHRVGWELVGLLPEGPALNREEVLSGDSSG